jgi:hypothetical protein
MYKFCLLTLMRPKDGKGCGGAEFLFFALDPSDLRDESRRFRLTPADINLLNPNTGTCPIFHGERDARITLQVYRNLPVIDSERDRASGWLPAVAFVFEMNKHAHLFLDAHTFLTKSRPADGHQRFDENGEAWVSLFEAKQIHQYDHRFSTYESSLSNTAPKEPTADEYANPAWLPMPRQYVRVADYVDSCRRRGIETGWHLTYRDVTNASNERTSIFAILPDVPMGNTWTLTLESASAAECGCFVADMNSFVHDFLARRKVGGSHLNFFVLRQLPAIPRREYSKVCDWDSTNPQANWVIARMLELTYTAWDLEGFGKDCGYDGPPFRWDEARRFLLRCELDAAYFHLYGLARDDVAYILDTFPIVKRKDEAKFGTYRTRDQILAIYDAMQTATATGVAYQTLLDPPPANIRAAHPFDWSKKPLALPDEPRVAIEPVANYAPAVMLELVYLNNGVIEWELLRKAWRLLADPDRLARLGEKQAESVARAWRKHFRDKLQRGDLIDTLSGFCHAGTLDIGSRDGVRVVRLLNENEYKHLPHVSCDARLALAVAATLPPEVDATEDKRVSALENGLRR